jgi:hypothetical protein
MTGRLGLNQLSQPEENKQNKLTVSQYLQKPLE